MDYIITNNFINSNNKVEEIKLSFFKDYNYYNVINLSEPAADGIEFTNIKDFKENLMEYIKFNYGLYDDNGEILDDNYYSDRNRIKYYILLVKNFIKENL